MEIVKKVIAAIFVFGFGSVLFVVVIGTLQKMGLVSEAVPLDWHITFGLIGGVILSSIRLLIHLRNKDSIQITGIKTSIESLDKKFDDKIDSRKDKDKEQDDRIANTETEIRLLKKEMEGVKKEVHEFKIQLNSRFDDLKQFISDIMSRQK